MSTDLLYKPGDFVGYRFCGGIGYAYLNAYKWYIPQSYENHNNEIVLPDPKIVYLATKFYGLNSSYGMYQSYGYVENGWRDQDEFYTDNPEYRRDYWPEGKQPNFEQHTKYFLPVYQDDILFVVNFEGDSLSYPTKRYNYDTKKMENTTASIHNKFAWFDKEKLTKALDVKYSTFTGDKLFAKNAIEKFEKRKAQVLLRKLTA